MDKGNNIPMDWIVLWIKPCGCAMYRLPCQTTDFMVSATKGCAEHEFVHVLQNRGGNAVR